jgi:Flp pilus assembly protein protease CpaA
MSAGNIAGAGYIELLAATGLLADLHLVAAFLVTTAIAFGLLALVMAGLTYARNLSAKRAVALARVPIPYGVAISIGGLSAFYMMSQPILFPG